MSRYLVVGIVVVAFSFGAAAEEPQESPTKEAAAASKVQMTDDPQIADGERTYFMFLQTATSGSFTPVEGKKDRYELVLEGVSPSTIYFSDRPARVTGHAPMQKFLDGLGFSEENPPNAAVEVQTQEGETDVVVAELMKPRWDPDSDRLTYEISILEDATDGGLAHYDDRKSATLPAEFSTGAVFIDDCPDQVVYCFARRSFPGGFCSDTDVASASDFCGALPGKKGTCYNWRTAGCRPCRTYFKECDAVYPNCGGVCGRTFSLEQDGSHAGDVVQ